uniref:Ras-related protein Rab-6-like n=1 Tax=Dermatophagoides pteronyssinus TaxID=6956 RepID=A0A6P6YKJ0_DERPT
KKTRIVFLGEQGTGKTSVITRFMYDTFDQTYQATIGIDFLAKNFKHNDKTFKLQLWDTAGQERFHSLIPSYIRDCSAVVVVYDLTNRESFEAVDNWIECVYKERGRDVIIALAGNKSDAAKSRAVSVEEQEAKAKQYDAIFFETSAKSGTNVRGLRRPKLLM